MPSKTTDENIFCVAEVVKQETSAPVPCKTENQH